MPSRTRPNSELIKIINTSRTAIASNQKTKNLLSDVTWTLTPGQKIAVFSTSQLSAQAFLECASGVTPPQTGKVEINGNVSWPIGMKGGLSSSLSGQHGAGFLHQIYGKPGKKQQEIEFIQNLSEVGEDLFNKPLKLCSQNLRERIFIAMGLAFDFDAYFIAKSYMWKSDRQHERRSNYIQALRDKTHDKSLVMTGIDYDFMKEFCNQGIVLHEGRIDHSGTFEECRDIINRLMAEKTTDDRWLEETEIIESTNRSKNDESDFEDEEW